MDCGQIRSQQRRIMPTASATSCCETMSGAGQGKGAHTVVATTLAASTSRATTQTALATSPTGVETGTVASLLTVVGVVCSFCTTTAKVQLWQHYVPSDFSRHDCSAHKPSEFCVLGRRPGCSSVSCVISFHCEEPDAILWPSCRRGQYIRRHARAGRRLPFQ